MCFKTVTLLKLPSVQYWNEDYLFKGVILTVMQSIYPHKWFSSLRKEVKGQRQNMANGADKDLVFGLRTLLQGKYWP